jgi:amino acid adenylation domain-containing protein
MEGERLREQGEYWKKVLGGAPELLELPLDHARPAQQDFSGGMVELVLDEKLTQGLKGLSQRHGTTLYMTLLAGWSMLLGRLSGQEEVVIGSPVANRGRTEIEGLIGFFVNTLALRISLSGSPTVSELLEQVKKTAIEAQQHQDVPFEQVVELLQPVRSLAYTPIFQVMFTWETESEGRLELSGLQLRPLERRLFPLFAKCDLRLALQDCHERITGRAEYATALFEATTLERYVGYFLKLLEGMVADASQRFDQLPILGESECDRVLYEWNQTEVEYSEDKCVHQLFEEQSAKTPNANAVAFGNDTLNYAELNRRANRLAHYLIALGVEPESRVAICAERSLEMIVAQLAVLKAGGAYVPLDPAYPGARLSYLLQDTASCTVITQPRWSRFFTDFRGSLAVLDTRGEGEAWHDHPDTNPDVRGVTASHLAYIMYTSGSTGIPKGAMIAHRAIRRLVLNNGYAEFTPEDKVAFASNPAFDATTLEVWAPLLNGGCVVVIDQSELLDPERFRQTLKRQAVSALWLTVGLFNQYADVLGEEFSRLRYLLVGGDRLDCRAIAHVLERNPPQHLLNGYGPTETTTFAATHEVKLAPENGRSIPIGRPITNTQIYILDAQQQPVPIGVTGELYIGGEGVARGYLNQPALTAERFLPDPFGGNGLTRMYKTGDIGRWLADGSIEFVGRNDFQVKIRGFRIELGEIEARLAGHEAVQDVVVVAREDATGDKRLVAYYTTLEGEDGKEQTVGPEQLRTYLATRLPEYMVPAAYARLSSLPLNANGKLDRKALPEPEGDVHSVRRYEAPSGHMETALAMIWADVLKLERVGRYDNFFELGGHSLMVMRVIARLRQSLGVETPVRDLFAQPVLADLARVLEGASRNALPPITRRQAQVAHRN